MTLVLCAPSMPSNSGEMMNSADPSDKDVGLQTGSTSLLLSLPAQDSSQESSQHQQHARGYEAIYVWIECLHY